MASCARELAMEAVEAAREARRLELSSRYPTPMFRDRDLFDFVGMLYLSNLDMDELVKLGASPEEANFIRYGSQYIKSATEATAMEHKNDDFLLPLLNGEHFKVATGLVRNWRFYVLPKDMDAGSCDHIKLYEHYIEDCECEDGGDDLWLFFGRLTVGEATRLLEGMLNSSLLNSLVTQRPPQSLMSHLMALNDCTEHARLWLLGSELRVWYHVPVTYKNISEADQLALEAFETSRVTSPLDKKVRAMALDRHSIASGDPVFYHDGPDPFRNLHIPMIVEEQPTGRFLQSWCKDDLLYYFGLLSTYEPLHELKTLVGEDEAGKLREQLNFWQYPSKDPDFGEMVPATAGQDALFWPAPSSNHIFYRCGKEVCVKKLSSHASSADFTDASKE